MASIYREGKGWAVRVRTSLHRRYKMASARMPKRASGPAKPSRPSRRRNSRKGSDRSKPHWL